MMHFLQPLPDPLLNPRFGICLFINLQCAQPRSGTLWMARIVVEPKIIFPL